MFDLFKNGRPERAWLSGQFGFSLPPLYTTLVEWIWDSNRGDYEAATDDYYRLLYLHSDQMLLLYDPAPRELFAIGAMDGRHVGFLLHAPELGRLELPIVEYTPGDHVLSIIAHDFETYLRNRWSHELAAEPPYTEVIVRAAKALNMELPEADSTNYDRVGARIDWLVAGTPAPAIEPDVPDDWWFACTADDVGVLAPETAFYDGPPGFDSLHSTATELERAAFEALSTGFPGTAQVFIRRAIEQGGNTERTNACLVGAHRALGRELLARRLEDDPMD